MKQTGHVVKHLTLIQNKLMESSREESIWTSIKTHSSRNHSQRSWTLSAPSQQVFPPPPAHLQCPPNLLSHLCLPNLLLPSQTLSTLHRLRLAKKDVLPKVLPLCPLFFQLCPHQQPRPHL
uniref:Uncharacterized protein n=1 Tax=Cacopsylla melanoneura TaxID=428564 RepID=A0A8D8VN08_9HEMI